VFYRIIDLAYSPRRGAIDDEPLQRILHGHRVIESAERFYEQDGLPHLLVSVRYELARSGGPGARETQRPPRDKPADDREFAADVPDDDVPLALALRAWRSAQAHDEAIPAFAVMTNTQLFELVRRKPRSALAVAKVQGLGDARAKKYSAGIVELVERHIESQKGRANGPPPSKNGRHEHGELREAPEPREAPWSAE